MTIRQRQIVVTTYALTIAANLVGIVTLGSYRPDWDWGYAFRSMMREMKR